MNIFNFKVIFIHIFFIIFSLLNAEEIQMIEHFYIPLSNGNRLAARMWIPKESLDHPVPAILEYLPYRKRDGTRSRDEPIATWYAKHGYAFLRVDIRGSGESDGFLEDEYLESEQSDGLEVIDWISKQNWCNGSIGMIGKSWGGFNALQIAAWNPSALKAIITVCSTDDRYADDIHYMGGCLLNDNLWWGAIMTTYQARPPDPNLRNDWREEWLKRIEKMPFWPALWMKSQRRNEYWKQGSVCENWQAIQCPVLAVGGWNDAYTNAISRLLTNLKTPRLGIIGPWAHFYPQDGLPGPSIGFMQESLRWWDYWLKGKENGIMEEAMLRAYIEEWSEPKSWRNPVPGHWIAEKTWPSKNINNEIFYFGNNTLTKEKQKNFTLSILSPQWTGFGGGEWMGCGVPGEMPLDQRFDDGCSLIFDSEPLVESCTILGTPEVTFMLSSDKPIAYLCVRMCDISENGSSRRISYQILNLTHHESHENPKELVAHQNYKIKVKLNDCGYLIPKGHKLRIALSTNYWPLIWPAPTNATLTIQTENSFLKLPIRKSQLEDSFVYFEPPESGALAPMTLLSTGTFERMTILDLISETILYITHGKGGLFGEGNYHYDEIGTSVCHNLKRELSIQKNDPLSANYKLFQSYEINKNNLKILIDSQFEMTSTKDQFHLKGDLKIYENEEPLAEKKFEEWIDRDHL